MKEASEWIRERVREFLQALDRIARILIPIIELALMVAIAAMMALLLSMMAAIA
jgi:hypothetical protein